MTTYLEPLELAQPDVASVPRRFGVGVLMILITAFAVLFAAMRCFDVPPERFFVVSVLFFGVTLAQILLFEGKKPRQASLWAGGVLFPLEILAICLYYAPSNSAGPGFIVAMVICASVFGMPFGYLAGCVMASVFLLLEKFRGRHRPPLEITLLHCTADDFDTLIAWLHNARLFGLWSCGRFRYPLDQEQLAAHRNLTAGETPSCLCFKAVCGEMKQMVAYVELANIDREKSRASIELAIVDPSRSDRGQLSKILLAAIMQVCSQQGLQWLGVTLHRNAFQSLQCFRQHGFHDEQQEYRKLVRSYRA
jgi:RimJ/RimL family protein N-acetyltransferase